jgi:hypothetical protein
MQISHDMERNNANHADNRLTSSLDIIGQPQKAGMPDSHLQSKGCATTAVQCAVIQEDEKPTHIQFRTPTRQQSLKMRGCRPGQPMRSNRVVRPDPRGRRGGTEESRLQYLLTRPHAAVTIARLAAPKSMCTSGCEKSTTFRLNVMDMQYATGRQKLVFATL